MKKITDNVYVETGFQGSNNTFVVTAEGVVMVDTPQMPSDAIKWRDEIAKHGKVRYLINSEPHGDHFSGNYFFEGTVVGHDGVRDAILGTPADQMKERMKEMAPDSASILENFTLRPPTITFSQEMTLYSGNHSFRLINLPGHSPYQIAVYIPEEKVVCTSDNVVYKTQPFLHQSLPYEWLESLKKIGELDADFLVPGHGEVCDRGYLPEMIRMIQAWIDAVKEALEKGISPEEMQEDTALLKKHGITVGTDPMAKRVVGISVTRLFEVLK